MPHPHDDDSTAPTKTSNAAPSQTSSLLDMHLPVFIDTAVIVSFIWLLPATSQMLSVGSAGNIALIAGAYLTMCGGLWLTKLIHPKRKRTPSDGAVTMESAESDKGSDDSDRGDSDKSSGCSDSQGCALATALPFSIFVLVMLMTSGGLLAEGGAGLDALNAFFDANPVLCILGMIAGTLFTGAFMAVLLAKPKPRYKEGSPTAITAKALGVLGIDAMILITAAYWEAELADADPMELALGGRILVFVAGYIFFLMFYAPPRLALLSVDSRGYSLLTFLVMLGVVVWRLTA